MRTATGLLITALLLASTALTSPPVPWKIKGVNFTSYWIGRYTRPQAGEMLDRVKALGVTHVGLVQWWWQDKPESNRLYPDPQESTPDVQLRQVIAAARERGLKVSLTLGTQCKSGGSEEEPSDPAAWLKSYRDYAVRYARLCKEQKIGTFVFGAELDTLSGVKENRAGFINVINAIRKVYSGRVAYKANWYNYPEVTFWDHVDLCGINSYFRLHPAKSPTRDQLRAAWRKSVVPDEKWWNGRDWIAEVKKWQEKVGKPVFFGEFGYASRDHAASKPWVSNRGKYNPENQVRALDVFFEVWRDPGPWFEGGYVWEWSADPVHGGEGNRKLFFKDKPAEETVRKWYGGSVKH